MSKRKEYLALVGRAFRGKDGTVRWVRGLSERNNYSLSWLNEETGVWNSGGTIKAKDWSESVYSGGEAPAPQPGDTYKFMGVLGQVREVTVYFDTPPVRDGG